MPNAGQRISEYILDAPLGRGAFGEVWSARHHVWNDQQVAIKIPLHPEYIKQLQREGLAVQGISHPNIVRPIGFDPFASPPYLIMEYVPGVNLRVLIKERKLSVDDSIQILRQILSGLGYAHSKGIIHRDIKPENILVHERAQKEGFAAEGVVKISDFGLGQSAGKSIQESIVMSTSLEGAAASELAGTIDYMSPEQRAAQPVDARSDLYSVGVILYEMLTGEKPAGTELPSDRNRNVPRQLDDVFKKSYARLDRRYATAAEFAAALGAPAVKKTAPAITVPPVAPGARQCPACRAPVAMGDQFCTQCGVQLVATVRRCVKCGAYPDASDRFCVFCGADVPPLMVLTK